MSELKAFITREGFEAYLKYEADKVIAEKDAEIRRLKNGIAPKQSDKTLQERLNEVCEKHGVSTLQDLDWAFCMTEARLEDYAKLSIDKHKALEKMKQYKVLYQEKCRDINTQERLFALQIAHHKCKRCLAMAKLCRSVWAAAIFIHEKGGTDKQAALYMKWEKCWLSLADKFKDKEAK